MNKHLPGSTACTQPAGDAARSILYLHDQIYDIFSMSLTLSELIAALADLCCCAELFMAADKDKSGALDRKEFTAVLMNANLGVTPRHVRQLLADCDENEDGVIEYRCAADRVSIPM